MKSRLIFFPPVLGRLASRAGSLAERLYRDLVFLSAGQASFFLITSAVPFLSLLAALTGFLLPADPAELPLPAALTEGDGGELFRLLTAQIAPPPGVPLLSVSAAASLWTASHGISAIRDGVGRIYGTGGDRGAFFHRLAAVPTTLGVMAVVAASSLLLFFGGALLSLAESGPASEAMTKACALPVLFLLLAAVFALLYAEAGRKSGLFRHRIRSHVPGALFSAAGWILFSLLYSVYIAHFPRAQAVYGGLGALSLVMLWLYVCTVILLLGAEVNRFSAERRSENNARPSAEKQGG